ncbi:hypothetical protein GH714_034056 [Hevea brasiliensis]|uniref:Uncharacterized protein n=1 Tax=Hevea brasiliensis TaxID=3981 RepID=A0A6A6L6T4_HEVBR|nr:hypothetical protein GH714_034056 [Hevea brasiliensis]
MAIVITPTLLVSTTVPDAFSAATDIAGGYCMTMLYGILPPAMAWAMCDREREDTDEKMPSRARPALVGSLKPRLVVDGDLYVGGNGMALLFVYDELLNLVVLANV